MSGLDNARGIPPTTRRAPGAKSRVPSRVELSDSAVLPRDSGSNAPHKTNSSSRRANGLFDVQEKRTERAKITIKDTTSIRTKSPVKSVARDEPIYSSQSVTNSKRANPAKSTDRANSRKGGEENVLR